MWTFARDIASATRPGRAEPEPWQVDPLTRKVFVHSLTAWLEPAEAEQLRSAFAEGTSPFDPRGFRGAECLIVYGTSLRERCVVETRRVKR